MIGVISTKHILDRHKFTMHGMSIGFSFIHTIMSIHSTNPLHAFVCIYPYIQKHLCMLMYLSHIKINNKTVIEVIYLVTIMDLRLFTNPGRIYVARHIFDTYPAHTTPILNIGIQND